MRGHHATLSAEDQDRLLSRRPETPDPHNRNALAHALGATLYIPATRPDLPAALVRASKAGATSAVVCLEDAVADHDVEHGIDQLAALLDQHDRAGAPSLFVRVRDAEHVRRLAATDSREVLDGFVLPKFDADNSAETFEAVADAARGRCMPLYAMPVLESPALADPRARVAALDDVTRLLAKHPDVTLAVRIGATDIAGALGLRRVRELTCYDLGIVRDAITDIRAVVGRDAELVPVVTGCVWEFFPEHQQRLFKPQLRQSVFADRGLTDLRGRLLDADLDGLIREITLDKANGLTGKTVIHPRHVAVVNALLTVTHEEASDAEIVLGTTAGGVSRSDYRNKMNEHRPHRGWAEAIQARGRAYGVLAPDATWVDLLWALTQDNEAV